ncbi:MAG TPA: gamma-glutamylcyclotransferase family protein [Sphingomicrobium sp.]|nr:gamma-glutamylcyclotransferase family protein [Sphingomicrobium sp.]
MTDPAPVVLFSYGTLRQPEVQIANYGRLLQGEPDVLVGYHLAPVGIADFDVIRISGKAVHTIAVASGHSDDRIEGVVFALSEAELAATDAYEADAYLRIEVTLESGRSAWAYVAF